MKTKLFTLLTLLLCLGSSGAWADDISVTYAYGQINSSGTGSASVANIISTMSVGLSQTTNENFNGVTTGGPYSYNNVSIPNYARIKTVSGNKTNTNDYVRFTITPAEGYIFTPSSVSLGAIREGTDGGNMYVYANRTVLNETTLGKSPVMPGRNAQDKAQDGYTFSYTISNIDASSDDPLYIDVCIANIGASNGSKTWGIWNVVISGTYSSTSMTKLDTPTITVTQATGEVTIGSVEHASKITYTTDGTAPTASSTTYSAPFTVDANCTIKAIAIGDGVSYSNSSIASQAANITVANPVLTAHNGTVGITCATDGATIKYSTDNETWTDYSHPLTYFSNTTVYAKAEHASYKNNSSTVNLAVSAAPAAITGSQTKILQWVTPAANNNWEYMTGDNGNSGTTNYGIQGKADTEDEGWSLWISPNGSGYYDKALSWATNTTTIDDVVYSFMKNSNGRQLNIGMPSNLRANRITIYSYNVGADQSTIWSTVGGSTYTTSTEVSIISSNNESPEIRVFALDDIANNIILNNAGYQQCFMAVVDYTVYVPGPADAEVVTEESSITETITFTSSSTMNQTTAPSSATAIMTLSGGSYKAASLTGFSTDTYKAYEFGSNASLTIAIPSEASDISLQLLGTASNSTFKYNGGSSVDPGWSSDATSGGYIATIEIADSYAGTNFVITKGSNNTNLHRIVLTYTGEVATDEITLTTSDNMAGWRAFNPDGQGYTLDANTTAYIITGDKSDNKITLTKLAGPSGDIPGNTCVLLHTSSSVDSYKMTLTKKTVAAYSGDENKLKASSGQLSGVYRLGYGADEIAFYPYSGTPATGTVYLDVSSAEARALNIVFDDEETTGVAEVRQQIEGVKGNFFDLQGRKVAQPTKGLYIVNGRKVLIK